MFVSVHEKNTSNVHEKKNQYRFQSMILDTT